MEKIVFTLAAQSDLREAAAFYAEVRPLHGPRFVRAVEAVLEKLGANPRVGHPAGHGCRRLRLSRLPYVVFYSIEDTGQIVVHAFMHERRDPTRWQDRLR